MSKTRFIITSIFLLVFALGSGDCDCDRDGPAKEQVVAPSGAESQQAEQLPTGE